MRESAKYPHTLSTTPEDLPRVGDAVCIIAFCYLQRYTQVFGELAYNDFLQRWSTYLEHFGEPLMKRPCVVEIQHVKVEKYRSSSSLAEHSAHSIRDRIPQET